MSVLHRQRVALHLQRYTSVNGIEVVQMVSRIVGFQVKTNIDEHFVTVVMMLLYPFATTLRRLEMPV